MCLYCFINTSNLLYQPKRKSDKLFKYIYQKYLKPGRLGDTT